MPSSPQLMRFGFLGERALQPVARASLACALPCISKALSAPKDCARYLRNLPPCLGLGLGLGLGVGVKG